MEYFMNEMEKGKGEGKMREIGTFQQSFPLVNNKFFSVYEGNNSEGFSEGKINIIKASRSHNLKINCFLKSRKDLATIWYEIFL